MSATRHMACPAERTAASVLINRQKMDTQHRKGLYHYESSWFNLI